jgi:hypothetical protein
VSSITPGVALEAERVLDPTEDRFLKDHTFSRRISVIDPDMTPLPVLPLTMTLEMMAEAAAGLAPGWRLIGMRDVRAYRWIAVEGERLPLRIVARRRTSGSHLEFEVQVHASGPPGADRASNLAAEGTILFGPSRPAPATAEPFVLAGERTEPRAPEQVYEEYLFHGPSFRGIVAVNGLGDDGMRMTLEALPPDGLFRSTTSPGLLVDPVLLDAAGQAVGYWATERLGDGYIYLPFRVEGLALFDSPPSVGERVGLRGRITKVDEGLVRADWELVREDGRLWARCQGWEDRRFAMPRRIVGFFFSPRDSMLSDPWPPGAGAEAPAPGAFRLGLDRFPKGFFATQVTIWERTLAYTVLAPAERGYWRSGDVPAPHRIVWLLGRIAAKDAVREELKRSHGLVLCPADIVLRPDDRGRLIPDGPWTGSIPDVPAVSVAHEEGSAGSDAREGSPTFAVAWITPDGE